MWIKANFRDDIVVHGFRHAIRDRLRAVQCPSEIIDQIGGWSPGRIGESYGEGHTNNNTYFFLKLLMTTFVQMVSKLDSLKPLERLSCPTDNPSMDDWMDTVVQKSTSLL